MACNERETNTGMNLFRLANICNNNEPAISFCQEKELLPKYAIVHHVIEN